LDTTTGITCYGWLNYEVNSAFIGHDDLKTTDSTLLLFVGAELNSLGNVSTK